jgi:hypothetical protein
MGCSNIPSSYENFFTWLNTHKNNCTPQEIKTMYNNITSFQNYPSISGLTQDVMLQEEILKQKENDADIAKARALSVIRPELNSSYYDGWFPLNRPLKRAAIPIFVFLASLFISISFSLFLGLIGIRSYFFVIVPEVSAGGFMTRPFFILLAFTIILFSLTIYAFMR